MSEGVDSTAWQRTTAWAADVAELTKPRITALVGVTTILGLYVSLDGHLHFALAFHTLFGTLCLVSSANVLNQALEKDVDALMARTAERPVPAGRRSVGEAAFIGAVLGIVGTAYLAFMVNGLTALIGFFALASYTLLYTPLKRRTWWCTVVGAVPGALPPVMGWTAARGELGLGAVALFGILFFWQLPHFWAIGWMYRDEYAQAGLPMLPAIDPDGRRTTAYCLATVSALVTVSLLPTLWGLAGPTYAVGAGVLGALFLWACVSFGRAHTHAAARRLLLTSIVYLPALVALMMADIGSGG